VAGLHCSALTLGHENHLVLPRVVGWLEDGAWLQRDPKQLQAPRPGKQAGVKGR